MKKLKKSGFILTETLIVSTFVSATLIFLFIQFKNIYTGYENTFKHNTINSLYNINQAKKFLINSNYTLLTQEIEENTNLFIDISSCPALYILEVDYCNQLFSTIGIKNIYFTNENISNLINYSNQTNTFNENMNNFFKYIKYDQNSNGYRLIAEFNDGTFASLNFL